MSSTCAHLCSQLDVTNRQCSTPINSEPIVPNTRLSPTSTNHCRMLADLAVGMVQSVAAEMVHRPLGEEDEAIAYEALLAPMLKDNDVRPVLRETLAPETDAARMRHRIRRDSPLSVPVLWAILRSEVDLTRGSCRRPRVVWWTGVCLSHSVGGTLSRPW